MRRDSTSRLPDTPAGIVEVLNGTGRKGVASLVAERLRREGFDVVKVGNAPEKTFARTVVARRAVSPLRRTGELVQIVRTAIPAAARTTGGNPAKRTFQALRIEVNGELEALERMLPAAIESLAVGGRIVMMAYQSLEDRLVKRAFARGAVSSAPADLPIEPESHRPYLTLLTRGADQAPADELGVNPRSASVRLRAAQRTRPTPEHLRDVSPRWAR